MLIALPSLAAAQAIVASPRPDTVAVTVYRDPYGSGELNLDWLQGFALISETRRVSLPAGEIDLRFEGVAAGLIPQSAVVSGLGNAVIEKNRDAKLLSPGTLLGASLGRRVQLRRTSRATGAVRVEDAVIRAAREGVVIETAAGIEVLRCTGLSETLRPAKVPATLSATPTLAVRLRTARAVDATVTLTYLSSGFDWRAHYVATLSPDQRAMKLFAWLTLANGDSTGFRDADTMAVAGRLNREAVEVLAPEQSPIELNCWPQGRTNEIPLTEGPASPLAPPPPPAAMAERSAISEDIIVTGNRVQARREALGDLKLYRIPIAVSIAGRSQKQVALIEQPQVKVETFYRWRTSFSTDQRQPVAASRMIRMVNRKDQGLGLPLPAGQFTLYTARAGQPFLLGEGQMTDRAEGEKVEVTLDAPGLLISQRRIDREDKGDEFELVATNDQAALATIDVQIAGDEKLLHSSDKLVRRDGAYWWTVTVPANGERRITIRYNDN